MDTVDRYRGLTMAQSAHHISVSCHLGQDRHSDMTPERTRYRYPI